MGARALVRLGISERPKTIHRRGQTRPISRQDFDASKLPLRTRALIITSLAILAWLPAIALGYVISSWS